MPATAKMYPCPYCQGVFETGQLKGGHIQKMHRDPESRRPYNGAPASNGKSDHHIEDREPPADVEVPDAECAFLQRCVDMFDDELERGDLTAAGYARATEFLTSRYGALEDAE